MNFGTWYTDNFGDGFRLKKEEETVVTGRRGDDPRFSTYLHICLSAPLISVQYDRSPVWDRRGWPWFLSFLHVVISPAFILRDYLQDPVHLALAGITGNVTAICWADAMFMVKMKSGWMTCETFWLKLCPSLLHTFLSPALPPELQQAGEMSPGHYRRILENLSRHLELNKEWFSLLSGKGEEHRQLPKRTLTLKGAEKWQ